MPPKFLTDAAKEALAESIRTIESRSAAEVVIAVRHHSGSYIHADVLTGAVAAFATLAFLLFSDYAFELWAFLIDPLVVGVFAGWLCSHLPVLRRLLTPPGARRRRVQTAARATFYDKRIRHTRERTGMLVYISMLERAVELVLDTTLERRAPQEAWTTAVDDIEAALRAGRDGTVVAARLSDLADLLELALPRDDDDINELPDMVCAED